MSPIQTTRTTNFRWFICGILFLATGINYLDRQVLSLTWKDFIAPEFAWTDEDYSQIIAFFSLAYAISMLIAGRLVDIIGTKKGFVWAVALWSLGAMAHGFCGFITSGILTEEWNINFGEAKELLHDYGIAGLPITTVSVYMIMACRLVMAIGQAAHFPAAISVTAEYFPKKDRAFAISVFNNGASVGALIAPITIPLLAKYFGWEMAFLVVGAIGYIWVLMWLITYQHPDNNPNVNLSEYNYIQQDEDTFDTLPAYRKKQKRISLPMSFTFKQTWALIIGKFMTDGVWWFFLFWTPVYISEFYSYTSDSPMGMAMIFAIYLISMLSIGGGYLPTYIVNKYGMNPFESRMRAMLIFASIQVIGIFTLPLGSISPWLLVLVIGIQAASHQSWSANLFAMEGDFFPKNSIATITGIAGFAGGLSSYLIMRTTGSLLTFAEDAGSHFVIFGYEGKQAAYMLMFCIFSFMYLIGWTLIKTIIPNQESIEKKVQDS